MNNEAGNAKLFGKIAKVMGECRILEKAGRNTFDKYDYVTADTIATRIGSLLAANGIAFFPSMVNLETSEYTTQKGGTNFRTVAHFQMTLACIETGATFTTMWMGEAIDRSDKSISKAATSAVKYFLLKTFLLAGGDEEDADSQSPTVEARQATQARTSTSTTTNATNGNGDAPVRPANPFNEDAMTDEEHDILSMWQEPKDAYVWAVNVEACANEHEARNSMAKIVEANGGKMNTVNKRAIFLAFLRRQNEKLQEHPVIEPA
jgi:hypothetical protein